MRRCSAIDPATGLILKTIKGTVSPRATRTKAALLGNTTGVVPAMCLCNSVGNNSSGSEQAFGAFRPAHSISNRTIRTSSESGSTSVKRFDTSEAHARRCSSSSSVRPSRCAADTACSRSPSSKRTPLTCSDLATHRNTRLDVHAASPSITYPLLVMQLPVSRADGVRMHPETTSQGPNARKPLPGSEFTT